MLLDKAEINLETHVVLLTLSQMIMTHLLRFINWFNKSTTIIMNVSHQYSRLSYHLKNIMILFSRRGSEERTDALDPDSDETFQKSKFKSKNH